MKRPKRFLIAAICLVIGLTSTISLAQEGRADFSAVNAGAGANLVIISVSGPATATLNQKISVTYTVKNQGDAASGAYQVDLYLSSDKVIDPSSDRLLGSVSFATGLGVGKSKKTTSKVLIPINGLSGKYYYGAVVATSKKASSKQVAIVRYTLGDNNETVTDHKTGLVWQQADDGQNRDWDGAIQYCEELVLGGNADWRLPRIDELQTIVDYSRSLPAIDPKFDCRSDVYWSSSTLVGYPVDAWIVYFYYGDVLAASKSYYSNYVRCVRVGPW